MWINYFAVLLVGLLAIFELPQVEKKLNKKKNNLKAILIIGVLVTSIYNIYNENQKQEKVFEEQRTQIDISRMIFRESKVDTSNFYLNVGIKNFGQRIGEIIDTRIFIVSEQSLKNEKEYFVFFTTSGSVTETEGNKLRPQIEREINRESHEFKKNLFKNAKNTVVVLYLEYKDILTKKTYYELKYHETIDPNIEPINFYSSDKKVIKRFDSILVSNNIKRYIEIRNKVL